jgi:hypothetical protein
MTSPAITRTATDSTWARLLDRTGVCASVGCALHCMVAPVLLIAAPTLGGLWVHPLAHIAIAALVVPIAAFALRSGYRKHGSRWIVSLGAIGVALVLLGAAWPFWFAGDVVSGGVAGHGCHDCCPTLIADEVTGESTLRFPPASIITLIGGIGLVTAHIGNLRCCAGCRH